MIRIPEHGDIGSLRPKAELRPSAYLDGKRVWVAGHSGLAGSALVRRLEHEHCQVITRSHTELDLIRQDACHTFVANQRPDVVIVAAALVGGILANARRPADFLYQNLMIAANVIEASHQANVDRLLFLASSCVYPRFAHQPMREDDLLTGPLEPTNEGYAMAKLAGVKLAQMYNRQFGRKYISVLPTNLYGPNDNYDPEASHVLPALIRKIHLAKAAGHATVQLWGSGTPLREFLHADDLADACICLFDKYWDPEPVNIGSGDEYSIRELAEIIAEVVGYTGQFVFDTSKPDGTPRKKLDTSRLRAMGWTSRITLRDGLRSTYELVRHAL